MPGFLCDLYNKDTYPVGVKGDEPHIIGQREAFLVHEEGGRQANDVGSGCQQQLQIHKQQSHMELEATLL